MAKGEITAQEGSFPLTRGKLEREAREVDSSRLIPAHAGKTGHPLGRGEPVWAHPRSRGENASAERSKRGRTGSSPLTRGKHAQQAPQPIRRGLIPAHAGKTSPLFGLGMTMTAHPRSRGENTAFDPDPATMVGSSPLTRGKHGQFVGAERDSGLIPAHAGKTVIEVDTGQLVGAHPRSRGENEKIRRIHAARSGSSPLTRGKLSDVNYSLLLYRLIPAHAGKTPPTTPSRSNLPAHPRSRGENGRVDLADSSHQGSSPLTRGKRQAHDLDALGQGLIPAHAGKTQRGRARPRVARAHPRSRGENTPGGWRSDAQCGSSPLTRGKLAGFHC